MMLSVFPLCKLSHFEGTLLFPLSLLFALVRLALSSLLPLVPQPPVAKCPLLLFFGQHPVA